MGAIRDLAEKFWDGEVAPRELWKPTGQSEELAPGLVFLHAFANVSVLRTDAGLLLIDTSNYQARAKTFAAVRAIDPAPVHAAIYTHGHAWAGSDPRGGALSDLFGAVTRDQFQHPRDQLDRHRHHRFRR